MQQLALELAPPPDPTFDSYFPARNAVALAVLRETLHASPPQHRLENPLAGRDPGRGERFIYLWGPRGSGKSHLLRAFIAEAALANAAAVAQNTHCAGTARYFQTGDSIDTGDGGMVAAVDDVERLDMVGQLALFDLYNRVRTGSGTLVSAGTRPPMDLPLREDLRTRLGAGVVLRLEPLTDEEKAAAISEHCRRRGLALAPELIEYLLNHVTRDMGTQMAVVDTLDRVSLERKRALTLPLLREVLHLLGERAGGRR